MILGLEPCARGVKRLGGREATAWSVARHPGERRGVRPRGRPRDGGGAVHDAAREHGARRHPPLRAGGRPRHGLAGGTPRSRGRRLARLRVTLPSLDVPAGALSGGNVQRMILARELAHEPRPDRRLLSDARARRAERGRRARAARGRARARSGGAADLGGHGRAVRAQRPPRRAVPRAHRGQRGRRRR